MSNLDKVSLIVINYNSTVYLNKLLKSTELIKDIIGETIVVDNNSKDPRKDIVNSKKIILIKNKTNYGFSKAVNQGIKKSKYNYILLLNPDTLIFDKSIINLFKKIRNDKKIGAIGGKIQNYFDNDNQLTATNTPNFFTALFEFTILKKIFPNNIFSKNFWVEKKYNDNNDVEVSSLCGAFILFRKRTNDSLNLFNESYFLYMEDIDFGLSIINKGYKVIFDPTVVIKHLGGASSESKYNIVLRYWYKSRKTFFKNHCNPILGAILIILFTIEENLLLLYHLIKHEPAV
jgi:GT2 family glycosyltransferase